MKSDRELLELAAKAMGRSIKSWNTQHGIDVAVLDDDTFWQPLLKNHLTDCMGDALRLACKLKLNVLQGDVSVFVEDEADVGESIVLGPNDDRMDATRRAIVRAAAYIGEAMP